MDAAPASGLMSAFAKIFLPMESPRPVPPFFAVDYLASFNAEPQLLLALEQLSYAAQAEIAP